jgi:hypothetical protein
MGAPDKAKALLENPKNQADVTLVTESVRNTWIPLAAKKSRLTKILSALI